MHGTCVKIIQRACVSIRTYPAGNAHAPYLMSNVACLSVPYFATSSHERYVFQKKIY
jgi:hypothetical protein